MKTRAEHVGVMVLKEFHASIVQAKGGTIVTVVMVKEGLFAICVVVLVKKYGATRAKDVVEPDRLIVKINHQLFL